MKLTIKQLCLIIICLTMSGGCTAAKNEDTEQIDRIARRISQEKEKNKWGKEKLPYPTDVQISKSPQSLQEIRNQFEQVSKQVAYRYCEKAKENSLPCCYKLAELLYASQEANTPQEFEMKLNIKKLAVDFCRKREEAGGQVYLEPVFERALEEDKPWTKETWKVFAEKNPDSPYIQLGTIESFSDEEALEEKVQKAKLLQKKYPEYLDIYYFLIDSLSQLQIQNGDDSLKTRKEIEHFKDLYADQALKQKSWNHLYYLSAYWYPEAQRTDGTTKNKVVEFLKKDLNPSSDEFDLGRRD